MLRRAIVLAGALWLLSVPVWTAGTTTFLQASSSTSDLSTYTFATQNFGTASADRYIIVGFCARKAVAAATTITSVTIGGVSASIVKQQARSGASTNIGAIAIAAVPTGTTGDIVVALDQTMSRAGYGAWAVTNLSSATATDTDSAITTDPSVSLTVGDDSFAIGVACSGGAATTTWTNLTERYDAGIEANVFTHTGASADFASAGNNTLTADFTVNTEDLGVFASWTYGAAAGGSAPARVVGGGVF